MALRKAFIASSWRVFSSYATINVISIRNVLLVKMTAYTSWALFIICRSCLTTIRALNFNRYSFSFVLHLNTHFKDVIFTLSVFDRSTTCHVSRLSMTSNLIWAVFWNSATNEYFCMTRQLIDSSESSFMWRREDDNLNAFDDETSIFDFFLSWLFDTVDQNFSSSNCLIIAFRFSLIQTSVMNATWNCEIFDLSSSIQINWAYFWFEFLVLLSSIMLPESMSIVSIDWLDDILASSLSLFFLTFSFVKSILSTTLTVVDEFFDIRWRSKTSIMSRSDDFVSDNLATRWGSSIFVRLRS